MSQCELGTFSFRGIEAVSRHVKARVSPGPKSFSVSGISDGARATRGRVLAAFDGIGLSLPPGRAHVELEPAGLAGGNGHYDLPMR